MTTTVGVGTSGNAELSLYTNSAKRLTINGTGRVIIGSETFRNNDSDKLTIQDDATDVNVFTYAPQGVSRLYLSSKGRDGWIEGEGVGANLSLKFFAEGSDGALERLRIDGGDVTVGIYGRVIIGSQTFRNNPSDILTIRDDATDVNVFTYAPHGVSRLYVSSNGVDGWIEGEGVGQHHSLKFFTEGTDGQLERLRIDGNGNVGIGTTSPSETLDVAGNIKAQGLEITSDGAIIKGIKATSEIAAQQADVVAGIEAGATIISRLEAVVVDTGTGILYTQ